MALGAVAGLGWKPLVTAQNPTSPSFGIGPLVGSVTQSFEFSGGPVDSLIIWARSEGGSVAYADVHLVRSEGGLALRSARFEVPSSAELQAVPITLAPIDLPAGLLALRVVAPEDNSAPLYVGATRNDAYTGRGTRRPPWRSPRSTSTWRSRPMGTQAPSPVFERRQADHRST